MSESRIVFKKVPWGQVQEIADEMISAGMDRDEVLDSIVEVLDQLIDLSTLGPVGVALEVADRPLIRALLELVVTFATDPERREARKARREAKRLERQKRRKERKESRNG